MTSETHDRELLELAAKAGGYEVVGWNDGLEPYSSGVGYILKDGRIWNPLACDGDALRLAVRLGISIDSPDPEKLIYSHSPERDAEQEGIARALISGFGYKYKAPQLSRWRCAIHWVSQAEFERVRACSEDWRVFWRDSRPEKFHTAYSATRRVIVLAAAEIQQAMEPK